MLKYEQETTFSMQAKTVQSASYSNDVDYVRMPHLKGGVRGKMIMPATKEIMKESTRKNLKKQASLRTTPTPTGDMNQDDYLNMTSGEESDSKRSGDNSPITSRDSINPIIFEQMNQHDYRSPNINLNKTSNNVISAVPKLNFAQARNSAFESVGRSEKSIRNIFSSKSKMQRPETDRHKKNKSTNILSLHFCDDQQN